MLFLALVLFLFKIYQNVSPLLLLYYSAGAPGYNQWQCRTVSIKLMGSILYYTLNKERQTGKSCDTSNPSLPQYYVNHFTLV